ncbi:hypothetical protein Q7P35_010894 [Cladosporium inversicolor]
MQLHKKVAELLPRLRPFLRSLKPGRTRNKDQTTLHSKNIMTTSSSPPKASFLGIPCELRLLIYDKVVYLEIDFCIEKASPVSTSGNKSLGERRDVACELPINKLALVCHSVAKEIRSRPCSLAPSQRVARIELRARALFLYGIYLRRLPCRVEQITALDVEVQLSLPKAPMSTTFLQHRRQWVNDKVTDLGAAMLHLLHSEEGILRDAIAIRDVRIHLAITKLSASVFGEAASDEFEREIRKQAEQELVALITPRLGGKRLLLMWH